MRDVKMLTTANPIKDTWKLLNRVAKPCYSDIYVVKEYWPDFKPEHFFQALQWYQLQDTTLGG